MRLQSFHKKFITRRQYAWGTVGALVFGLPCLFAAIAEQSVINPYSEKGDMVPARTMNEIGIPLIAFGFMLGAFIASWSATNKSGQRRFAPATTSDGYTDASGDDSPPRGSRALSVFCCAPALDVAAHSSFGAGASKPTLPQALAIATPRQAFKHSVALMFAKILLTLAVHFAGYAADKHLSTTGDNTKDAMWGVLAGIIALVPAIWTYMQFLQQAEETRMVANFVDNNFNVQHFTVIAHHDADDRHRDAGDDGASKTKPLLASTGANERAGAPGGAR